MTLDTQRILNDAEVAAIFLRAIVEKGVPMSAAVNLTSAYLTSRQFAEQANAKPKEPWEETP